MSTTAQQKGSLPPESDVSSLVKDAVRQARKSSRIRSAISSSQPPAPNGLAVKTSFEHREDTLALALQSPTLSEMDQLLAPTYESSSYGGSSGGTSGSFRGSSAGSPRNDIIRKVELEIATARKAATEAHARLADASKDYGVYDGVDHQDSLDDADFLQEILSVSSVEESTGGDENMPEDASKAGESVMKKDSDDAGDAAQKESASIASKGSFITDGISDVPTQRTFEDGVELALEDTLPDTDNFGVTSNDLTQAENSSDDDSDYTEETVTDDDGDDKSEYTEESVHSDDGGPAFDNSEFTEETGHTEDRELSEHFSSPTVEHKSKKTWFAGTRGWIGGGEEEPKSVTPRSFSFSPTSNTGKAEKPDTISVDPNRPTSSLIMSNGHGEVKQRVSVFEFGRTEAERKTQSSEGRTSNLWLVDPEIETNIDEEAVCENARSFTLPVTKVGSETIAANTGSKNGGSSVQFKYPYPVPPKVPKPRPVSEIISDHSTGTPERVTRWIRPTPELEELLLAVKGTSMPRRSNACGALKVLVTRQPKNVFSLVRTVGFLEALAFACSEDVVSSPEMETALIARSRAVTTIMKVSVPKENRVLVMMEPGLPESLVKIIKEDTGEARTHACAALAMLAKTPANREPMAEVESLVKVLAEVVNGTIDPTLGPVAQQDPVFKSSSFCSVGDSGDDDEEISTGTSSTASPLISAGNYNPESIRKQKDGKQDEFAMQSKHHACAVLMHLSKHCPISVSHYFLFYFFGLDLLLILFVPPHLFSTA